MVLAGSSGWNRKASSMIYKIIGTGSSGNALLLENGILVDCGVPYKDIKDEVIGLVLLTHRHSDHFRIATIKKLAQDHPMIRFAAPEYLAQDLVEKCLVDTRRIDIIQRGEHYDYGLATIMSYPLVHDVDNVGWWLEINGQTAVYITDTGTVDHLSYKELEKADYYFLEANYEDDEIDQRIEKKLQAGDFAYEARVKETHLSLKQAQDFIAWYAAPDSKVIWIHQHKDKEEKKKIKEPPEAKLKGLLQPVDENGNVVAGGENERMDKTT